MSESQIHTAPGLGINMRQQRSDLLVEKVRLAVKTEKDMVGWDTPLHEVALELCTYHLEMRDHALRCEAAIHRMTK